MARTGGTENSPLVRRACFIKRIADDATDVVEVADPARYFGAEFGDRSLIPAGEAPTRRDPPLDWLGQPVLQQRQQAAVSGSAKAGHYRDATGAVVCSLSRVGPAACNCLETDGRPIPKSYGHGFPAGAAPLESILCTEELHRRPSRPPDYEKENRALVKLVSALADSPTTIFQTLADTILDIAQCDSAG